MIRSLRYRDRNCLVPSTLLSGGGRTCSRFHDRPRRGETVEADLTISRQPYFPVRIPVANGEYLWRLQRVGARSARISL